MTPAEHQQDTQDPGYDAWLTTEADRLACDREDLRARYPDDGTEVER